MNYLAPNLQFLRKQSGYRQAEMPVITGVSRTTWGNYENNVSEPDVSKIIDIAKMFGVSIDDLLTVDLSENVHLIKKEGVKKSEENVHLNVHPNVHPKKMDTLNEPDSTYGNALKREVDLLILRQLNTIADDVAEIKKKLP